MQNMTIHFFAANMVKCTNRCHMHIEAHVSFIIYFTLLHEIQFVCTINELHYVSTHIKFDYLINQMHYYSFNQHVKGNYSYYTAYKCIIHVVFKEKYAHQILRYISCKKVEGHYIYYKANDKK